MNKTIYVLYCLTVFSLLTRQAELHAQESAGYAGVVSRMSPGTRAAAMGGAFTALANDASASYWNPAGLHIVNRFQFELMNARLSSERHFNFIAAAIPVRDNLTLGLYWSGLGINAVEGRSGNTAQPDFMFDNSHHNIAAAFGVGLTDYLFVGAGMKIFRNSFYIQSATGLGFDGAIMLKPYYNISVAMVAQNLGAKYSWNGDVSEEVPVTFRFGTAVKFSDLLTAVADFEKTREIKPKFRIGAEFHPVARLPIRLGFNKNQISGGVGFGFDLGRHNLELNYAYIDEQIWEEPGHRFSLVVTFGARKEYRPGPVEKPDYKVRTRQPEPPEQQPKQSQHPVLEVTATRLNVRSGPGIGHDILQQVNRGERYPSFESSGSWIRIRLQNGESGWVHVKYVRQVNQAVK